MKRPTNIRMHPIFKFRTRATEEIIQLLESVTLGTDGAHYRHLDTRERIQEADNPLFLSMERHEKVLGNVTFCQRDNNWYIRYFAFDGAHQAQGKKKSSSNGLLKRELNAFFDHQLNSGDVDSFYAYIDPRNVKSLWMSENFGFKTIGKIATQTYSSVRKPKVGRVQVDPDPTEIPQEIIAQFEDQNFFFTDQLEKGNHFFIRDEKGELIAFAKTTSANWEIKRLPGKFGGTLVKVLPYIPFLNKLIRPKNHAFTVPEAVFVNDNNPQLLQELFNGILAHSNQRVIIWWVDEKDELYTSTKSNIKWGLLHKVIGVSHANLVERSLETNKSKKASYTSGFDFI
ncbi:MAG: hypothetical protein P8P74_05135 [Crocinitomicaceae bacterium]|nr:hypothetical protein [Crocinitomicaceae bacterium]